MPKAILVVEDDAASRRLLTDALEREGYRVSSLADVDALEAALHAGHPDLAVVDVHLGDGPDGFEAARIIRRQSDAAVIFLSAAGALDDRLHGFDVGGDDYITKPVSVAELLARIDAVLRRVVPTPTGQLRVGDLVIDEPSATASRAGIDLRLSALELSLLRTLMRNANRVLSKHEILLEVWGFAEFHENLVEVYVSSLRRKMQVHGPRLIHTVRGAGYVLRA